MTGAGANELYDLDISGKDIPSALFFPLLCALGKLGVTRKLKANGNGWNKEPGRIANYRNYVIGGGFGRVPGKVDSWLCSMRLFPDSPRDRGVVRGSNSGK